MREQHPLDDLFARALRDAEATPPEAVWEGIVQERGWAHLTLLRLRRRWGWVALVLLLGGAAAYQGGYPGRSGKDRTERLMAVGDLIPQEIAGAEPAFGPTIEEKTGTDMWIPIVSAGDQDLSEVRSGNAVPSSRAQGPRDATRPRMLSEHPQVEETDVPAELEQSLWLSATISGAIKLQDTGAKGDDSIEGPVPGHNEPNSAPAGWDSLSVDTSIFEAPGSTFSGAPPSTHSLTDIGGIERLPVRWPPIAPRPGGAWPHSMTPTSEAHKHVAWWVAATCAGYHETRTWRGKDERLNEALQRTEAPHGATGLGVLLGMERRGGWNMAVGLEYNSAHYDFQHLDQFRSRRDSLVAFVITFNSQVVDSYVDTIHTFTEVNNAVTAENRYSVVRVPVEGGWHRASRRWHFGARAGVAVEYNTLRSGVTLVHDNGGTRSVGVADAQKRTSLLLSGSLAADVGYAISERWGLWASPTVATCLFPLASGGEAPYASTDRFGVRLRLAYTLHQQQ